MARNRVGALSRWIVHEASRLADVGEIVRDLAERLRGEGLPVDRATAHFSILDPRYVGITRVWTPDEGLRLWRVVHSDTARDYRDSPLQYVRHVDDWLDVHLDRDARDFPVFESLRHEGYVHYVMAPLRFSDGTIQGASWATRQAGGFGGEDLALLRALVAPLALVIELKRLRIMSAAMLGEYVGRDPAERILNGTVRRGDLVTFRAALLFADLVGFTAMSQRRSAAEVVACLNRYFEAVDAQVEGQGGEILKFIGDGVFAIFPERAGKDPAVERALAAAHGCLETSVDPLRVAVHEGEIAYGNVGSPRRLDFTAIGPDVNLLDRLLNLGRTLGEPLVWSSAVAASGSRPQRSLGRHATRGFDEEIEVFAPAGAP